MRGVQGDTCTSHTKTQNMKLLSTYLRGKSLTVCFAFPEAYDMANIDDLNVSIGSKQFTGDDIDISGKVACVRLKSEDTYKFTGDYPVIISIDDKTRGVIPIPVGDIRFVTHRNSLNNASTNEQNDIVIALSITQTTIDVDSVLYDVMKGDKGDAGTIEVGAVTTGDAGTDVFVENVGTSSEAVLNFTIPRGDAGYTPYIGVNGNWFINGVDTGVQAEGDATESWVAQNYLSKLDFVGEFEPVRDKLEDIEDNANNYVHPATHPPEIIEQDANNRFVTDAEKSTWNGKQNDLGFTPENAANKQNSLTADGTGEKYPTVDAVNSGLATKPAKTTQVVAGAGLTGGGTLESDRTLNVVSANDGITVNADNIQLNAVDNLASTSATQPLSANQGKVLDAAKVDKVAGKSLILDTEISRLASVTNQTLSGLGGEAVSNKTQTLTVSETDYPSGRAVYEPMVNTEHAIADIVAHLVGRIKTLEELLVASRYNTIQVKELSVVENVKLKGADKQLFGTGAPTITPDFAGQEYLDQTAKIWYDAVGVGNAGDWKPRTNA